MKANELRIGNWCYNNKDIQVTSHQVQLFNEGIYDLLPIPLTEEWLVKFGFDKVPNSDMVRFFELGTFHLYSEYYNGDYFELSNYYFIKGSSKQIKYVHQLQNLYYALTQTELKLK